MRRKAQHSRQGLDAGRMLEGVYSSNLVVQLLDDVVIVTIRRGPSRVHSTMLLNF